MAKTIVEAFNDLADIVKATKDRTGLSEDTVLKLLGMQIDMHVAGLGEQPTEAGDQPHDPTDEPTPIRPHGAN